MKKISVSLALCFAVIYFAKAQTTNGSCGTSAADQWQYVDRLKENVAKAESGQVVSDRSAVQYVPIHFHIVGDAAGSGKHKESSILDQLCDLNEAYAPFDIRFYLSPHPTYGIFDYSINNANVYAGQTNTFLMSSRRHNNAVNVFVVNQAFDSNNILAYYSPPNDWVVSRKDQINGSGNGTLPHEVGHFFSLFHTFYGYEDNSFGPGSAGWPTAPTIAPYHPSPGVNIQTERQNGTNCSTAADMICDTPPDYNFGLLQTGCATYNGGAKDPLGTLVDPDESNFMGYFSNCGASYHFSTAQQNTILADVASPLRNFLDNNFTPVATAITTPADLLLGPVDADTTDYYNQVLLEWKTVTGATMYLLEIDINGFYNSPQRQGFVLTGTSKLMTNLAANKKYYWRVRPFNEYVTCADSKEKTFRTSLTSSTTDIKEIDKWLIAPNPVSEGSTVRMFLQASNHFEAGVSILDATGRLVRQESAQSIPAGESRIELSVEGLSEGLYFVVLQSGSGSAVRKLTVAH